MITKKGVASVMNFGKMTFVTENVKIYSIQIYRNYKIYVSKKKIILKIVGFHFKCFEAKFCNGIFVT